MRLSPATPSCALSRAALVGATTVAALAVALPAPAGAAAGTRATATATPKSWLTPLDLGPAPAGVQKGLVPRVGITSTGRGTVAWNVAGDGTIQSRDFTVGGTLGTTTSVTRGSLVGSVARDQAGNIVVTGQTAGAPASSWVATRAKDGANWTFRMLASGTYVNAPASFGLKSGFLVTSTSSFTPTTADAGLPSAAAFGFTIAAGAPISIGKVLEGVETGDFAHGADGSNWAVGADGHAISTGRRETSKAKNGKAAASVPALVRVGKSPTRNSILGAERFGAGAVATTGTAVAIAGLDVQQTSPIAQRGVPVVALGENATLEEAVEIGGVPDRRALEVDVAGRVSGGAVVTWLQQTTPRAENLAGQAKWAIVDDAGDVETRGSFSTAKDARDLRVVRTGGSAVATWIQGTGDKARWHAAKLTDDGVRLIKAPAGTPVGRVEGGLNTSQLVSNGSIVALTFVDATTGMVRVATQKIS
ncbi:MAG: hypothetical protein PGN13_08770 [Patulibacter minatonensis]